MNEEQRYRLRTPASARYFEEARRYLPGGDSRSTLFYPPYPAVLDRGEGCRVVDLDGNRLLDFTGNHSVLIHGYVRAGGDGRRSGARWGRAPASPGPPTPQLRLARHLVERIASLERVRFTNSGTEAVMMALRGARTFTGAADGGQARGRVSRHVGGRDGHRPSRPGAASGRRRAARRSECSSAAPARSRPCWWSRLPGVGRHDPLGSRVSARDARGHEPARHRADIRRSRWSVRVAYGGAEEHLRMVPDMTCLGKLIGGGQPLGAFGGREEIMALFDPSGGPPGDSCTPAATTPIRSVSRRGSRPWSCSPETRSRSSTGRASGCARS